MPYDAPTPRGIRKPTTAQPAQLARLFGENADDTDAAIDAHENDEDPHGDRAYTAAEIAALSGTFAPKSQTGFRIVHGSDANVARPTGYTGGGVWIGTVEPNNMATDGTDEWIELPA